MKASFNDHVITTRPVHTDTGETAPAGTHGFVLRVIKDPDERYVAELYLGEDFQTSEETALTVLLPVDFDLA
ncbi:MAG: hypothetical protein ACYDD4_01600 [Acidimicrobiales bacterium]